MFDSCWVIQLKFFSQFHRCVAVKAYGVLHGFAPPYLSQLTCIADLPGGRRLRSSSTHSLLVSSFRRSTVGRRSFSVAASVLWNSLPLDIQSSRSLTVFRQRLKTFLFRKSFPHILLQFHRSRFRGLRNSLYLSHAKKISID